MGSERYGKEMRAKQIARTLQLENTVLEKDDEIARLRAALEVIAAMSEPIATSSWDEIRQGLEAVGARARRALDGKEADGE